uniref:RNA-directed DNA polymerase n=1 Tax=Strigamia maritima TaxID=126957 RepID=T1ILZ6_STRMM
MTEQTKLEYQALTRDDPTCQEIINYIQKGWPAFENMVSHAARAYWPEKDNISTLEQLLFHDNKLIPPLQKRRDVLTKIHDGHLGIIKMKGMARNAVWWPGIKKTSRTLQTNVRHARK